MHAVICGICTRLSFVFILILVSFYCSSNLIAQEKIVLKGKVQDENNNPIPDIYIYIKLSKSLYSITNSSGEFEFILEEGKFVLVFNHIAYKHFEREIDINIKLKNQYLNIVLEEKNISMDEVLITSRLLSATPSLKNIKRNHLSIAGGTSVVVLNPNVQRLNTLKDALKFEPGVVIQELFGANDQPRISIRGSGIQSNPPRRGIYFSQDGIPINFADGSFVSGVLDLSVTESIEVFKGANALKFGTATLGGIINLNSKTGRFSPGINIKTELGSYGYSSFSMSIGDRWKNRDAYLSVSGSRQNGFRQHNQNKKMGVAANFGYQISNNVDNRTYLNYSFIDFDIPGPLPLATLLKDPTQINEGVNLPYTMGPNIVRDKPKREAEILRFANRTAFRINTHTEASLDMYFQNIEDRLVFPIVLSTQHSSGQDYGLGIHLVRIFGKHKISFGIKGSHGVIDRRGHINKNGLDSYMFSKNKLTASNLICYTESQYKFNEHFNIIANLQLAYNERNSKDQFPNPELRPWYSHSSHVYRYFYSESTSLNQSYTSFNPRIGAIYNLGKEGTQLFANISSSYEPPTFDELIGTAVTENINTSPKKLYAVQLDKQTAITAEFGSRYEGKRYAWNISMYQSWLQNELLEVKDFVLGVKETKNYPNTIHRGIEVGLMFIPFKGIFSGENKDRIELKTMYTYNDFYFSSGAYKNNSIAGNPPHYINSSIEYNYPEKFFLSIGMESQPHESYVDHQNTLEQPSYTIYGFRVGFEKWKKLSFYVEAKNVFNKYYASSYVVSDQIHLPAIPFPQFNVNNIAFFMPGQTRAFYVGLSYKI